MKDTRDLKLKQMMSKYTTFVTFVVLLFVLAVLTRGRALTWDSIKTLIIAEAVRAFASLGVGMIIITKGIDLSIGYVVCLTASVAASFAQIPTYETALYYGHSFPLFMPILMGLVAGGLFGLFNGVLVAYGKLPPFIATLGTMSIARGIQLIYTKAAIVSSLTPKFKAIAQNSFGPSFFQIPYLAVYVVVIAFIVWVLLRHTKQGTNFYAIGGNAQAARVSGINVEKDLVCVYFYAGLLYGCAGVLLASRLALANALTANGMELDAIAAVTVGGVSQNGGVGTVGGMIIGIFTMGLINYGMSFLAIDSYYQYLVKGAIIIVAVFFDMKKYAKRA
ncbi:ABC transporter permease [Leadbettera azotonutricia]|uniref:Autoinducer 2 import system permease protein LsrD n=1 Tax=Leadbettera azotonutricia (strain ATCC BAA-888 / DSM 13862 / ZAS-9) TaxID=545695 RepID=F5Y801_LEAAZ|nr:ABC transporter permease [Leadbettera azotonutricia]AEF83126.1 galactoside transport system permease protein MglC [Leadbettera azotonutricia ZAS-9]